MGCLTGFIFTAVLLQSELIRGTIGKAVADSIKFQTGWDIRARKVEGVLPFQFHIEGLTVKKEDRTFWTIDLVEGAVSPLDLFHGSLVFSSLLIDGLHTEETDSFASGKTALPPVLLRKISTEAMTIRHLELQGQPEDLKHLEMIGSWNFHPLTSYFSSQFLIHHRDYSCQPLSLSLIGREEQGSWKWGLKLNEGSQGLIHHCTGIQVPVPLEIAAEIYPPSQLCEFSIQTDLSSLELSTAIIEGSCRYGTNIVCQDLKGRFLDNDFTFEGEIECDTRDQFLIGELTLKPFEIRTETLQGAVSSTLTIRGPAANPSLTLSCWSPQFDVQGLPLKDVRSQTVLIPSLEAVSGEWIVTGKMHDVPLSLAFQSLSSKKSPMSIPKLSATFPSGSLEGSFHFHEDQADCKINGRIYDLAALNLPVKGSLQWALDTSRKNDLLVIKGTDIVHEKAAVEKLTIQLNSSSFLKDFQGNYSLTAQNVHYLDVLWDEMSLSTSVDPARDIWPFAITTSSHQSQTEVNASGGWHWNSKDLFIHLGVFCGNLWQYPFELQKPVDIFAASNALNTTHTLLNLGTGTVSLEGKIDDGEVNALLDLKRLPADLVNWLLPNTLSVEGKLSLFLRLMGPQDNMEGSLVLKGKELQLHDGYDAKLPVTEGRIEAVLTDKQLTFEGRLASQNTPFAIDGKIPLSISCFPFRFEMTPNAPLKAHLKTSGEVTPYLQLFGNDAANIQGHLDIDIDIGGLTKRPIVNGVVSFSDGFFESLNTGFVMKEINCTLRGNEKKLFLDHFSGNDGDTGKIGATGYLLLDQKHHYPFEFHVNLEETKLLRQDTANLSASGNVVLSGDSKQGKIQGDLTVDSALLEIPKQLPTQMKTVEVTFINDPEEVESSVKSRKEKPWPIALDLHFNVPSNVHVNGRALESEWRGEFSFTGTTLEPIVHGTLQLTRGEYSFNGASFVSHQGSVNFAGDPYTKTTLYVVGEQQIDNIKVQAILKGDLNDPVLDFRSNPAMSQKEILAWILFGHGIDEITPSQTDQLTQSIFTLSSGEDDPDMLGQLRSNLGIDRLDISRSGTEEFNELSLRLGKYLSRGIYVSLSKSINAEANQVAIEANLTRHLKVQAEVGDNAEGKMSLKWAKDY